MGAWNVPFADNNGLPTESSARLHHKTASGISDAAGFDQWSRRGHRANTEGILHAASSSHYVMGQGIFPNWNVSSQVLLSIARALLREPKILLVDQTGWEDLQEDEVKVPLNPFPIAAHASNRIQCIVRSTPTYPRDPGGSRRTRGRLERPNVYRHFPAAVNGTEVRPGMATPAGKGHRPGKTSGTADPQASVS